ncbi:MAG: hypothetical protein Q4C47_04960, partial [Planctomycetia bacterium]|nr:hypothetical protein [Planctomycetia bacterium]
MRNWWMVSVFMGSLSVSVFLSVTIGNVGAQGPAGVATPATEAVSGSEAKVASGTISDGLPDPKRMIDPPTAVMIPTISRDFLTLTSLALPLSILRPEYPADVPEIEAFRPRPPHPGTDTTDLKAILTSTDPLEKITPVQTTIYGVTCGKTTLTEVKKQWGEPLRSRPDGSVHVGEWSVGNVGQVEVTTNAGNGIVTMMVVRLNPPESVSTLTKKLGLESLQGTPVRTPSGNANGLVYPERGFSFGFTEERALEMADQGDVSRIVIESLSPELFRARVDENWYRSPAATIPDLQAMASVNPDYSETYWLLAQVHTLLGHPKAALVCAQKASGLEPENERFEMTVARLLLMNGDWTKAATMIEKIVARPDPKDETRLCERARAHIWLGDLAMMCVPVNFSEGVRSYTIAVQLVQSSLVQDQDLTRRLTARQIILDAYLGGSYAMALSDWLGRDEALNMWLVSGESVLDTYGAEDPWRFVYLLRTFSVGAVSTGFFDAEAYCLNLEERSQRLLRNAAYTVYQRIQIRWEKALAMMDAAWIFQRQGDLEKAERTANLAIAELQEIRRVQREEKFLRLALYLTGRMEFLKCLNRATDGSDPTVAREQYSLTIHAFRDTAWLPTGELFRLGTTEGWLAMAFRKDGDLATSLQVADHAMEVLEDAQNMAKMEESGVLLDLPLLA